MMAMITVDQNDHINLKNHKHQRLILFVNKYPLSAIHNFRIQPIIHFIKEQLKERTTGEKETG